MILEFEQRINFYLVDLNLGLIWYTGLLLKISFWGSFRYTAKKQYILKKKKKQYIFSSSKTALILPYFPKHFLANYVLTMERMCPLTDPELELCY